MTSQDKAAHDLIDKALEAVRRHRVRAASSYLLRAMQRIVVDPSATKDAELNARLAQVRAELRTSRERFSRAGFNAVAAMMADFDDTATRACSGENWAIADSAVEAARSLADAWKHTGMRGEWLRRRAATMTMYVEGEKEWA